MNEDRKPSRIVNTDTGQPEDAFRALVRDALGLDWSTRDAAIFAELKRLKVVNDAADQLFLANDRCLDLVRLRRS